MGYFYLWVRTCWVSAQTIIRSGISSVAPCRLARTWNIRCYKWDLPFFQDSSEPDSKVGLHPEQSWQSWPPLQFQFGNLWKFVPACTNICLFFDPRWKKMGRLEYPDKHLNNPVDHPCLIFGNIFSHNLRQTGLSSVWPYMGKVQKKRWKHLKNLGLWRTHTHLPSKEWNEKKSKKSLFLADLHPPKTTVF